MNWIAVGLKQDLPLGVVIPSRIEDTELAIWRSASGEVRAWSDRCPHRGMRLSHGFVRGNALSCIYHGWQYSENGSCAYIPAHPKLTPPDTICVPTYDCAETDGVIWAALQKPLGAPPAVSSRRPVRSMPVARSARAIAAYFNAPQSTFLEIGSDFDVALALQPCTAAHCVVHALAARGADRKAVSRWLEALRSDLEESAP